MAATATLDEIYNDFVSFGLDEQEIGIETEKTDLPIEVKVGKCVGKYIREHDDILPEHKPLFYKLFARHERWTSEKADRCIDITIYQAGPEIKSLGTVSLDPITGTKIVHSIAYDKCIYSESAMNKTKDALRNSLFYVRDKLKDRAYTGYCANCKSQFLKERLMVTYGKDSISTITHEYFREIHTKVLPTINDGTREQLANETDKRQWLDYFVKHAEACELLCRRCNDARHATRFAGRISKFSHFKPL